MSLWQEVLAENPLIAILRGLDPGRAIDVADVLVDCGFRIIEVPLNSPEPLRSIETIAGKHGDRVIVGAGTVLSAGDVSDVVGAGGSIIVAPDMNPEVGGRALSLEVPWCPGVLTPTEAFGALRLGASVLKLFPAELVSPQAIAALRAVLPQDALLAAVGGITPETMRPYHAAGADSFGLGSALFKPTYELDELRQRAAAFVKTYAELKR
ncbi:2-dehydro-3-deoxy-6-phosphogalactonate aldolase [Hoeflea sp.]|uniref:2-dehydro-3-deoxy-6-phosphogalactonate aldolase n=1 Tax=Hoeflea sp. TaxID=1940281 RepID=UPI003B028C27